MKDYQTGYPSIDRPWVKYFDKGAEDIPLPDCGIYEYVYNLNKDYLDETALIYFDKKISYREMFRTIDDVAVSLQSIGVRNGDIVSLCLLTTPEALYLLYAINKIGAISNWLGLTSSVSDLIDELSQVKSKVAFVADIATSKILKAAIDAPVEIIVSISATESMPTLMKTMTAVSEKLRRKNRRHVDTDDRSKIQAIQKCILSWREFIYRGKKKAFVETHIRGEAPAIIVYTGGSTGIPKGVVLSSNAVNAYPEHYLHSPNAFDFQRGSSMLCVLPTFVAIGIVGCMHISPCLGAKTILFPDPSPDMYPKLFIKYRPNHSCGSPVHINALMQDRRIRNMDLSFITSLIYGGEKATKEWESAVTDFIRIRGSQYSVINGYGMSEAAGGVAITPHKIGKMLPFAKNNVKIIDTDTGEELKYDQEGEICISSPTLMIEYFNKPEETQKDVLNQNGCRWLRTGDLGKISADGTIDITGRIKRIYWRSNSDGGAVRVYPMRIEEEIDKVDVVLRSAVVPKKDDKLGYISIAFIILCNLEGDDDPDKALTKIGKRCKESLPESHVPDHYVFVNEFPLTRGGKTDYCQLEAYASSMVFDVRNSISKN